LRSGKGSGKQFERDIDERIEEMRRLGRERKREENSGNKLPRQLWRILQFVYRAPPFVDAILLSSTKMSGSTGITPIDKPRRKQTAFAFKSLLH
jgi:hypothetical protein